MSCGASLPARAEFCPSCGRPQRVPLIDLERLDAPTPARSATQHAVIDTHGGPSRRVLTVLAGVVVAGLAAVLVVGLVTGGGTPDIAAAPGSTTTIEPTTIEESTTTQPPPATASTVPPAPVAPVPTAATTTTLPYANQRRAAVLGHLTGGESLYAAETNGRVYRVELDTGRVSASAAFGGQPQWYRASVIGNRLVLSGRAGTYLYWADLQGDPVQLADSTSAYLPGSDPDHFWFAVPDRNGSPVMLRQVDALGRVVRQQSLPEAVSYAVGMLGDRIVVQGHGRIYTVGAGGDVVPYAVGTAQIANGRWLLWVGCDDTARCTYRLGSPTQPDTGRTSLDLAYLYGLESDSGVVAQGLAPDGLTVVAVVRDGAVNPSRGPSIVDLATGSVLDPDNRVFYIPAWTPDGVWIFRLQSIDTIEAVSVRTGQSVSFAVPGLVSTGNGTVTLAAG